MIRTALSTGFLLVALAATSGHAQAPATPDSLAQGRKLFLGKGLCFTCHGKEGEGVLGPTTRLAGRALTHVQGGTGEIAILIKAGVEASKSKSGIVMPPRGGSRLTDAEVDLVAAYVKSLNGKKG